MIRPRINNSTQANLNSEHELTLEEICPIWSSKLRNGIKEEDRSILSGDSKYCLVGEAWGFTGKQAGYYIAPLIPIIGCWTCIKYGRRFGKIAKKNRDCTINNFEQLISEFLTHWNQKHKAITATLALHSRARRVPNTKEFF